MGLSPVVAGRFAREAHLYRVTHKHTHLTPHFSISAIQDPLFSFSGHPTEGFAMDWSPVVAGRFASGDCKKHIYMWEPTQDGKWNVDKVPFKGHTDSVEDIQWSPSEANVCGMSVGVYVRL